MKNNNVLYIVLGFLLVAVIAAVIFLFPNKGSISWNEDYSKGEEEQPYDLDVIYGLLNGSEEDRVEAIAEDPSEFLAGFNSDSIAMSSSYVFFDETAFHLDSTQVERLIDYASLGNDVFFASNNPPGALIQKYFEDIPGVLYWKSNYLYRHQDSLATVSLVADPERVYAFDRMSYFGTVNHDWFYMDSLFLCDAGDKVKSLGYLEEDKINFFKINVGEGHVFVHSNPLFFTNYSLLKEDAFDYSNQVFSHINTEKIYWSEWKKPYVYNSFNSRASESPLRIFLEEIPFRWAWYFLLVLLFLFLIFRAKRDRPAVPVLEKNKNTSIEYVEAIVNLYFNKKDHSLVLRQLMQQWHTFIRKRYGVNQKLYSSEAAFVKALVNHSGISEDELDPILEYYRNNYDNTSTEITHQELIRFYRLTENFYKKSK